MRRSFQRIRDLPGFPLVPFIPLAVVSGLVALSTITLISVRRLARSIERLEAAPA